MFILILSTLINYSFAKDHGNGIVINKKNYKNLSTSWHYSPKVIICHDSPYKKETIEKAINIWSQEGVKIGSIHLENKNNKCNIKKGKEGYIQIMGYRGSYSKKDYHAFTFKRPYSNNKSKTYCKDIEFSPDVSDSRFNLLVHELGHAFGYDHYDKKFDIMNR